MHYIEYQNISAILRSDYLKTKSSKLTRPILRKYYCTTKGQKNGRKFIHLKDISIISVRVHTG